MSVSLAKGVVVGRNLFERGDVITYRRFKGYNSKIAMSERIRCNCSFDDKFKVIETFFDEYYCCDAMSVLNLRTKEYSRCINSKRHFKLVSRKPYRYCDWYKTYVTKE
jgi:hypothetical protein